MSTALCDLLIGTSNRAKGRELTELLQPYGFAVQTLHDVSNPIEVVEDGDTFAANAQKKARELAQHLQRWVLADDSGLEVDALGGAPGIYSARYASVDVSEHSDSLNNAKLISELAAAVAGAPAASGQAASVPAASAPAASAPAASAPAASAPAASAPAGTARARSDRTGDRRGANYYCAVAIADPSGAIRAESSGICRGRIRTVAAGCNGFGYDPLFEIVEYHRTFGELGPRVKAALSHRARALRAIVPQLAALAENGEW